MDFLNDFTNSLTNTAEFIGDTAGKLGEFVSSRPILGVFLLTILVCIVGWEATHPPAHSQEEQR